MNLGSGGFSGKEVSREDRREDRLRRLDVLKGTIVLILVGLTIGL
jgi:hypothetical protein